MLEQIENLEKQYVFDKFDRTTAYAIGTMMANKAINQNLPITIEVYLNDMVVYRYSHTGSQPINMNWSIRKRNSVLMFGHSTMWLNEKLKGDYALLSARYGLNSEDYTLLEGSFPILTQSGVIGAISVSGLKPQEDHQIIVDTLNEFLAK
jgi:uncharacterized protein (UPF0303 family)